VNSDDRQQNEPLSRSAEDVVHDLLRHGVPSTDVLVPDGTPLPEALRRTTALGIGAHPDDLEIGMTHAILSCHGEADRWFTGVTCTDGSGSLPAGLKILASNELAGVRREEQRAAARLGGCSAQIQLGYPSASIRSPEGRRTLARRIAEIIEASAPDAVFTHSLADRHSTHVAVALAVIEACKLLPADLRPHRITGVEIWGSLDWLAPEDRVVLSVDDPVGVSSLVISSFASQLATKRYEEGAEGRWIANATFDDSHAPL
jgi:LmbE family N-acetylglucosaminyl deacetylase